jgi:hypothetical protein
MFFAYDKLRRAELRRNTWRFAIRSTVLRPVDSNTMLLVPPQWSATQVYDYGNLVQDSSGYFWVSIQDTNQNNAPGSSLQWDTYFGPLTVDPWAQPPVPNMGQPTGDYNQYAYYAGEVVYEANNNGGANVYMSLQNSNSVDPGVPIAWSDSTTDQYGNVYTPIYTIGQTVQGSDGFYYMSQVQINSGNDPTLSPKPWDADSPYVIGNKTAGLDGKVYYALKNSTGVSPVNDATGTWQWQGAYSLWTPAFAGASNNTEWLQLNCTLRPLKFLYPAGSGPSTDDATRNVYWLPGGYLRFAPQDPKAGSTTFLGASTGLWYNDWTFGDSHFTTRESWPIVFRFVADITQVPSMDPMFCEGLGARLGYETCETITQDAGKKASIASAYKTFMSEARIENGIETGPVEPPEDDYVTCRI